MPRAIRTAAATALAVLSVTALSGCGTATEPGAADIDSGRLSVIATVAPIADLVRQVAGSTAAVGALVPDGVDSHTFEPTARDAARLAEADLFIANGLRLEEPSIALAEANLPEHAAVVRLGEQTVPRARWVFDRSFPRERGAPNPHVWLDVVHALRYVDAIERALLDAAPPDAAPPDAALLDAAPPDAEWRGEIRDNARQVRASLRALHDAIRAATGTVPAERRKLLTYHDSWAYFGPRYGFVVVDAVQPAGMDEPSAADVRRVIEQIRAEAVPAVFGSEVFPSGVLQTIAAETGVRFVGDLADDALPGEPGDAEHSYQGMMVRNVRIIVDSLGGDASALDAVDPARLDRGAVDPARRDRDAGDAAP